MCAALKRILEINERLLCTYAILAIVLNILFVCEINYQMLIEIINSMAQKYTCELTFNPYINYSCF